MFDAKKATETTIKWIQDWFEKNGPGCNAIVGISGGKDSSIVAALLVEALGKDRVIGVLMPNGEQPDIDMAHTLVNHLGIEHYTINIKSSYDSLMTEVGSKIGEISTDTSINLAPRLRMSTLYAVAQSRNGRVANTCNLSEDWIGFSTRYGDAAGDFCPICSFTTTEVRAIGRVLGVPEVLVNKAPSDGLTGMTDEDRLGFTYETLDRYIRTGEIDDTEAKAKIDALHTKNLFKIKYMDCLHYEA